ncbi:MAG: McrB family protein [Desulfovibrio piger]|uniref:AAA domain-containing protein n=2 Tax=Desulfovibrio piger TaxID=901 RepID=A0A848CG01_9BACT|nr:AAA family ATPase [Desulfovibrio piger]NME52464.1 AAA domain-containing protein [Desulfovibrio piger]
MADIVHLDGIWTKFLELWPVEKVRAMTLEQYHSLNDPACFQRCLESMAGMLGSIRGKSAIKFGIYERNDKDVPKEDTSHYAYSDTYAWRPSLGGSPEEAFAAVKENILSIIEAMQNRDLDAVSHDALWPMIAWKIAFLYQDRNDPQVLSVYKRAKLIAALGDDAVRLSTAELYRRLMARRNGKNLHEYSEEIWNMTSPKAGDSREETTGMPQPTASEHPIPLNQILYGPPGTGKTYATVEKALEIFAAAGMRDVGATREKKRQRFDELVADGHIRFVTFHQSFSYEDFVEGIRASTDDEGRISYQVEDGIFKELCREAHEAAKTGKTTPYVLIIDEINRGNISRIFGELITLVEASHRACLPNSPHTRDSISVRLPYSRDLFSVPENVYIIGTMNTADRSLTGLDAALRRRFSFMEMPPRPELLEGSRLQGTEFSLADLLDRINRRITVLLDKEHRLGHAWFMGLGTVVTAEALAIVFRNHILPLLEEYFFEDWEKIRWVLNDHRKELENRLLRQDEGDPLELFGENVQLPDIGQVWHWNEDAFENMDTYVQIINVGYKSEKIDEEDNFFKFDSEHEKSFKKEYSYDIYRIREYTDPPRYILIINGRVIPPEERKLKHELRPIAKKLGIDLAHNARTYDFVTTILKTWQSLKEQA